MEESLNKYINITIYGKGKSAISFSKLKHYRKKEDNTDKNDKGEFKGYKLQVTTTHNGFKKDKDSIYIEYEELLNIILVMLGKINSTKCIRNSTTSNTEKTFSITNTQNGTFVNFDVRNKDKLGFTISNLNKIILTKMILEILLKEIPRVTGIYFSKEELIEYINSLIQNKQSINSEQTNQIQNNINTKEELYYVSFINSFNNKKYINKIQVDKRLYSTIKEKDSKKITNENLLELIKNNTDKEENKFLNINNIDTLTIRQ